MNIVFRTAAWHGYLGWRNVARAFDKLNDLILECCRDPFRGTGKPESLGGNLSGWRSRRISQEHRPVYRVRGSGEAQALEVLSCRYHH